MRASQRRRGPCARGAAAALLSFAVGALGVGATAAHAQAVRLRVIADGQDVTRAADAIVQDGVVMAPYQGLFEPMGIRAAWDPHALVLTLVSPAGDEMQLRPNDPYATVNGERRPIPIPLVTVLGRVLIPVEWVFDTLGDVVAYDPGARTVTISAQITGVSWRSADAGFEVTLDGTAPLHAEVEPPAGPGRLVVDVPGAVARPAEQTFDVREGSLAAIRVGPSPAGTRVVLDLTAPVEYRLRSAGDHRVVLALSPLPPPAPSGARSRYTPSAQRITDIRYEHVDGGGRVTVVATRPLRATEHLLRRPDRIVLDVADAVFIPVKKFLDVNDGLVVQVRAAQFHQHPNVVRIVVELTRPAPYLVHAGAEAGVALVELGAAAAGVPGAPPPGAAGLPPVIALDAGHGGSDPGAIGPTGLREKDVTLAIAEDLRALLAQQRLTVVMVRQGDVFVPLEDRAQIAARAGATVFVSIHANASVDAAASGTQTFYATPESAPLAAAILEELSQAVGLAPRGTTQARFAVLVQSARIPAVLVETAFITNPREEQMLRDPEMQRAFAQGILRGITRYLAAPPAAPQ